MKIEKLINGKNVKEDARLPKEFKKKWLAALRSGKFKQGIEALENDGKYCCLGVACRIVHPKINLQDTPFISEARIGVNGWTKDSLRKIKVPNILKGEDDENIIVRKLSKMNDGGSSFKKIAAWIEKNL
jgi:hypothetical protein